MWNLTLFSISIYLSQAACGKCLLSFLFDSILNISWRVSQAYMLGYKKIINIDYGNSETLLSAAYKKVIFFIKN